MTLTFDRELNRSRVKKPTDFGFSKDFEIH